MSTTELHWVKSSYSGGGGGNCVEVAAAPTTVRIRDSKDPAAGSLTASYEAWTAFADHLGDGSA
ncbi:DUF397 domain-containing protein [Streptomyces sp. NBC_01754]|uniref:DUF397 domain-containing protein n=1 Tax=Streptomyces sp. NBC_01754 TaxID=2975930 RepID=UPI002DD9CAA9|nr:DUF397 domain-containing protein [Streptomyces sp. NBC_01754]WSC92467.1 DUF397 domain-containing protein [Streptomyces sp. NBC_01754]